MPLAFREKLTMLMPPSLFYRRRIADETRSGEPELSVLGEMVPRGGTAVDVGANLDSSPMHSRTSLIGSSLSSPIPTTPSSHVGCCAVAPRFIS